MRRNTTLGLVAFVMAILFFGLYGATAGGITGGPGNCTFGAVYSVTTSATVYQPGQTVEVSGTIGGDCSAAGDSVYWALFNANGQTAQGAQIQGSIAYAQSRTFAFTITAPSTAGAFVLWASLCPAFTSGCQPTAISGVAQTSFQTVSNTGRTSYTVPITVQDTKGNPVFAQVYLYSQSGRLVASSQTSSTEGCPSVGQVCFYGVGAGVYSVSYFPTSGPYAPGSQNGLNVAGSSPTVSFTITVPIQTVTQTSTSSPTVTGTQISTSGSTTVTTTATSGIQNCSGSGCTTGSSPSIVFFLFGMAFAVLGVVVVTRKTPSGGRR